MEYFYQTAWDGWVREEVSRSPPLIRSEYRSGVPFAQTDHEVVFCQWLYRGCRWWLTSWEGDGQGEKIEKAGIGAGVVFLCVEGGLGEDVGATEGWCSVGHFLLLFRLRYKFAVEGKWKEEAALLKERTLYLSIT